MRNRPEIVRSLVALLATKRCVVTLSPLVPRAALADEVRRLQLPAVIFGEQDWDAVDVQAAASNEGGVSFRVCDHLTQVVHSRETPQSRPLASPNSVGVAIRMLTSGTTGPPRRVDLTYEGLASEFRSTAAYGDTDELADGRLRSGTAVTWAPLVHVGGVRAVLGAVLSGRRLAMLERFEVESWRRFVMEHRPKTISLVPTALRMVLDANVPVETLEGVRAITSGTAPASLELIQEFQRRYGVPVLAVYGATEFGGVAGWTLRDWKVYSEQKCGSVGRANSGVQLRTIDPESGSPISADGTGLLEVRAAQTGRTGWVRTTDMARIDADGFVWILGRCDDVIIRGGFKVSLNTVRSALLSHPDVLDAAVIARPHPRLGEVPVAAVELRQNASRHLTSGDLTRFLEGKLSRYQIPVMIKRLDAIPRTPSLKEDRTMLTELLAAD
jgi:long-chain acyl-CoA synthetase